VRPRRRLGEAEAAGLVLPEAPPSRRRLALAASIAALLVTTAVALSATVFVNSREQQRAAIRDAAVVDFVRSFVTQYTSLDPFNANDYVDRVLAQGTGTFAEQFGERMNEIVIRVAQAEPGVGTVSALGIERWNPDGSARVVAVANTTTTMPDGKRFDELTRWVVTAAREGEQWKVSDLIQVI